MPPRRHSQGRWLAQPTQASSPSDADATGARPTQECMHLHSDVSGSAFSSSSLSSVDGQSVTVMILPPRFKMTCTTDNVSPLASPQRHHGRHHEQSHLRGSPQGKGADMDPSPLVWVRVTRSGKLARRERGSNGESYWWPACVRRLNTPLSTPERWCPCRLLKAG